MVGRMNILKVDPEDSAEAFRHFFAIDGQV